MSLIICNRHFRGSDNPHWCIYDTSAKRYAIFIDERNATDAVASIEAGFMALDSLSWVSGMDVLKGGD